MDALPVDVFLGRTESKEGFTSYPEFVKETHQKMSSMYTTVSQNLREAYQWQKQAHQHSKEIYEFQCGDRVWLYVPAIKRGQTKKFSSLWRGPYTVIDKTSSVNYRIQLIGTTKTSVVHRNRLKLCFGEPQQYRRSTAQQGTTSNQDQRSTSESHTNNTELVVQPVVSAAAGGYTSSSNEEDTVSPAEEAPDSSHGRPQRNRRPPSCYDDFVPVGDEDVSD